MNRRPLRALYVGYTSGTENHGDEALKWIISQLLSPEFEVVSSGSEYDVALLGGGTLINQSPWLIDHFRDILKKAPLGGMVFGTGVGDESFWGNHMEEWRMLLRQCDLVGVRGPHSHTQLLEAGCDHAEMIGDPYLALATPLQTEPRHHRMAVNVGVTNDSLWGGKEEEYLEYVYQLLATLNTAGWDFLFYSVWSKDLEVVAKLRDRLGVPAAPLLDARMDALELLNLLPSCQLVLGEKLHGCAMAAVAQVPFIALEYQPKVRDFAASVRMEDLVVSTAVRDVEKHLKMIDHVTRNREIIRVRLQKSVNERRDKITEFSKRAKHHYLARQVLMEGKE